MEVDGDAGKMRYASEVTKLFAHDIRMICLGHFSAAFHTLLPYLRHAVCWG
jgi:hypothetical protein